MENEVWRDILGYEGLYQVSDQGRFRSYDRKVNTVHNSTRIMKGKLLTPRLDSQKRYFLIDLYINQKSKTYLAHRLVALAHIPNPENLPEVNHKSGDTTILQSKDLEWVSRSDNEIHKYRVLKSKHPFTGRLGKMHSRSLTVIRYDLKTGQALQEYESNRQAEADGYISSCISLCCNNQQKKHKGFGWKFK